jgi:hypothetical protein
MKKSIVLIFAAAFLAPGVTAYAATPADSNGVPFGDGFPGGHYYVLNIIGKQGSFTCPQPEYADGLQVYGNVIFIPRDKGNGPVTVLMESGDKGPKGAQDTATLEVTDWCTESFPDTGGEGDGAILRLPQDAEGYAVYARVAGRPGEYGEPAAAMVPDLFYVEDEAGNDLIFLGQIDLKGKGAQKTTDLTPLFEWTGEVCYVQPEYDLHCQGKCTTSHICCVDANMDYTFERCDMLTDVGEIFGATLQCPGYDADGIPYVPLAAQCNSYENEWIFNIGDLAGYLWDHETTGSRNIQVRFYPINQ